MVPAIRPSSVDFPAPLAPTMPVRSPGAIRHSTSRSTGRPLKETDTSSRSTTTLPSRAVASLASSTLLRSGGTSAINWLAASMRNLGFEVRAGGPRRNQASSLRIRFCRLASAAAASRARRAPPPPHPAHFFPHRVRPLARGGGAQPVALDPLQHVRRVPAVERLDD